MQTLSKERTGKGKPLGEQERFADQAYLQLEEKIVTLQLPPGTVLSEAKVSEMLGIGRTPIREALQRLAHEHLVEIMPRRGIRVTEIDIQKQLLLLAVRRELERYLAGRAARRATKEEREAFARMAEEADRAADEGDNVTFIRLDRVFHVMVAQCARNEFAERAIAPLNALSRRFWFWHYRETDDLAVTAKAHAAIMRGIGAGDPDAARAATDRLLDYVESFTRATLDAHA